MSTEEKSIGTEHPPKFSPKEFLKARRPERFSDSAIAETPALNRSTLEYHLDTLTSRNQDVQFAIFARHLAEKEICPNLLPQTGPTGGGDSKVDSETYPVADTIALGWYMGIGREAASERWGFAFSAKKKWQDKFISDVAKAVETNRGYRKIFFVTNQFVRDKVRAASEDKLRQKYGVDVRILDRTWILDTVFKKGYEKIAAEDLQLVLPIQQEPQQGPLDAQRTTEFKEVEKRIQEALVTEDFTPQLAEDCIEAAGLARGLERPRSEVEALYDRAEQIATKCGTDHQRIEIAYQKAWTAYWWYEDYTRFDKLYDSLEQQSKDSKNANDLERLSNCWSLLHSAVLTGNLNEKSSNHSKRTEILSKRLQALTRDEERPSTALHAQSLLLNMRLILNARNEQGAQGVLQDFKQLIQNCEGLAGFPFEPVVKILTEVGTQFGNLPLYEDLFNTLVSIETDRKKDVTAARMLLKRGEQQIQADRPYDAIRSLGLSLGRLYKYESRRDALFGLYLCAHAYERVGLLWAARGTLLSAASLATGDLAETGQISRDQAACYRRLKWVELQLGRISHALAWHQVDNAVRAILIERGELQPDLDAEVSFDGSLGVLLLKADFLDLSRLSYLPDTLDRLGLFNAWVALLYALGYEDDLRSTFFQNQETPEEEHSFFLKWRDQPSAANMPAAPILYEEQSVVLESDLLGCKITVESENASPCVELSESILAALESLLSTGTVEWMTSREPVLSIRVRKPAFVSGMFDFELQESTGRPHMEVSCGAFNPHIMPVSSQHEYREGLVKLLGTIVSRIVISSNMERDLTKLFRDELALERSVNFTGSFVTTANVLGNQPKTKISNWADTGTHQYPLKRRSSWDANDPRPIQKMSSVRMPLTPGKGEPPLDLRDRSIVKQNEIRTISLIRDTLWQKAEWSATVFASHLDGNSPPMLALGFKNIEAGKQIFEFWNRELGIDDQQEKLRIVIVKGINEAEPFAYRVLIGSNPDADLTSVRYAAIVSRINTMHAKTDAHMQVFSREHKRYGQYFLMPALFKNEGSNFELIYDRYLIKRELHIRNAWEIGRHDPDSIAIESDDKPVIPAGKTVIPVREILDHLKTK